MKCIEVNELIQRQLDSDVSEIELQRLHQHIDVCAECKAFYERLRQVHLDLESLPKVALPYSIVDSILPEIDRIDRLKIVHVEQRQELKKKWFLNNRWLSGLTAVTAGIVIIFAITQPGEQKHMKDAALHQENQTMQISGLAKPESAELDTSKELVKSKTMGDNDIQASKSSEAALTQGVEETESDLIDNAKPESANMALTDHARAMSNESTIPHNKEDLEVTQLQKDYSIAKDSKADKDLFVTPTFTTDKSSDQKLIALESPDHTFIALYNGAHIEIKGTDGDVLMEIDVEANEQFSNLVWISNSQLQYSIQSASETQTWVYDISSGVKTIKPKE